MSNQKNDFLTAEEVYDLPGLVTAGGEDLRALVSMALCRVPAPDRLIVTVEAAFVVAGHEHAQFVPNDSLKGRSVLILMPAVFALDEEQQIGAVLDLAACVVLASRQLTERPRPWEPLAHMGEAGKFIVPLVRRELDRQALVRRWLRAWVLSYCPGGENAPAT
jgi:hypothetical protein